MPFNPGIDKKLLLKLFLPSLSTKIITPIVQTRCTTGPGHTDIDEVFQTTDDGF